MILQANFLVVFLPKTSEHDQEMTQSRTIDQPSTLREGETKY